MSLKGIDVSYCNGCVDWVKAKAAGLQFAILQLGYGNNSTSQDDEQFNRNVKECERLHIPWGGYLYSYAQAVSGAQSELQYMLRLLRGHHPQYPVRTRNLCGSTDRHCAILQHKTASHKKLYGRKSHR